jgi:hypothetical protein
MGSILLINGQPLQTGQTITLIFETLTTVYCQSHVIGSFMSFIGGSLYNPFFLHTVRGTITLIFYNPSSLAGSIIFVYSTYGSVSGPIKVNSVPISIYTIFIGSYTPGGPYTYALNLSVGNLVWGYFYTTPGSPCFRYDKIKGTIVYTINGSI